MRKRKSRLRADGFVWCPAHDGGAGAWLLPDHFTPTARGCGYRSCCRACSRAKTHAYTMRRALADPAWYASKRHGARDNARRRRQTRRRQEELHAMFTAADAAVRARGMSDREIGRRVGISHHTLQGWRQGRGHRRDVVDRLVAVAFLVEATG